MKIRLSLLCIAVALCAFNVADAQPAYSPGDVAVAQPKFRQLQGDLLHQPGFPGRLWLEANFADEGLGFQGSYFTLGGKTRLFQDRIDGRWLTEGQVHFSLDQDDGEFFANIGIERVFSIPSAGADVSVSAWYDYNSERNSGFSHAFNQVGVNASIKTQKWDLIGNGYFPTETQNFFYGGPTHGDCFVGNDLVLIPGIDSALQGFDVMLRTRPKQFAFVNGTLDIGGYQYSSDVIDAFGGAKVRFGFQILKGMIVNVEVNNDDRFNTTGVLGVGWLFGANASGHGSEYSPLGRDLEQTVRNDHIVRFNQDFVLAIDPDTGVAYNVIHVDNTAAAGGDGTAESEFSTLAAAEAGSAADDIIFVREGDGTSTGYDTGIALQTGQFLLGDGVAHTIPLLGGDTFALCNDVDGARPILANDGGDIVTLADRNVVAGFVLDGFDPADSGIVGVGIAGPTVIRDNEIKNLLVDGIRIDGLTGDLLVADNTFNNIQGDAVQINDVTSTGGTLAFDTNTIDDIGGNGIKVDGFDAENTWMFTNNTISNVGPAVPTPGLGDGIALVDGSDSTAGVGGTFLFDGNTIDTTTRHGISIEDVVDPEASFTFLTNTITNPGTGGEGDGLAFINSLGDLLFDGASFTGATNGAGFRYDVSGGGTDTLVLTGLTSTGNSIGAVINASGGTDLTVIANDNVFDANTSHGIQLNATDSGTAIHLDSFAGNTVTNNGGRGLEFNGDTDTLIEGVVVENLFENNALGGLVAETFFGEMNMTIGGVPRPVAGVAIKPAFPENQFVSNGEVGIGLVYRGDATGRFNIDENIVTGTTNDVDVVTPFEGDGIHVRFGNNNTLVNSGVGVANALLAPSTINRNLVGSLDDPTLGNAGDGIELFSEDEFKIAGLEIKNNVSANNGLNGLKIEANDSSEITDVLISENVFNSNGENGVQVTASESALISATDPFGLRENTINNNVGSGVSLAVAADAQLTLDIDGNEIDRNGADGIVTTEIFNVFTETRAVSGTWQNNLITNNAGNGINSGAFTDGLVVNDNFINTNGLYGVSIPGAGDASYFDNEIIGNGTPNAVARGSSGGINIFVEDPLVFPPNGPKELLFARNVIFENTGDGIRIVQNSVFPFEIVVDSNTIEANSNRGVSVLNQGDGAVLDLTLTNNKIASNLDEGVFIVNTSSTDQDIDQNIDVVTGAELLADGDVTAVTIMNLLIDDNQIINNGAGNENTTNGLIMLVGTNDGGYGFEEDGFFFSDDVLLPPGVQRGGIGATVSNNVLLGNAGDDVFIRSFTSTLDPATTGGAWTDQNTEPRDPDDDAYNPAGYVGDALARLDLIWLNNDYQGKAGGALVAVTNVGAVYNNDEPVFKSRTAGQDDGTDDGPPDDNGPFGSGTRDRNAQRLGARNVDPIFGLMPPDLVIEGPPLVPFGPPTLSTDFLFAGMGQSTFRLLDGSDSRADLVAQGFIMDDPYLTYDDAQGVGPQLLRPDEMPFGWNFFADNAATLRPQ